MILDASAVLALLQDERGADAVEDAVDEGAVISAVNLSEVLAKMADAGATAHEAADLIVSLFVEVEPFGLASARRAAHIRGQLPNTGLSLGDRACLALAAARGLPVLTADQAWLAYSERLAIDVRSIR
jgi:PIN domain nuclease of toxin-antitoxin system